MAMKCECGHPCHLDASAAWGRCGLSVQVLVDCSRTAREYIAAHPQEMAYKAWRHQNCYNDPYYDSRQCSCKVCKCEMCLKYEVGK